MHFLQISEEMFIKMFYKHFNFFLLNNKSLIFFPRFYLFSMIIQTLFASHNTSQASLMN